MEMCIERPIAEIPEQTQLSGNRVKVGLNTPTCEYQGLKYFPILPIWQSKLDHDNAYEVSLTVSTVMPNKQFWGSNSMCLWT